jgi:hypothetical protein
VAWYGGHGSRFVLSATEISQQQNHVAARIDSSSLQNQQNGNLLLFQLQTVAQPISNLDHLAQLSRRPYGTLSAQVTNRIRPLANRLSVLPRILNQLLLHLSPCFCTLLRGSRFRRNRVLVHLL